jgi:hypothetical protein
MATNPRTPAPNTSLHRTPAAAPPSPVSSKPFGAAVKVRAGAGASPCVAPRITGHAFTVSSPLQRPAHGLSAHPWHLEGLSAKAYRASRGIQLI